MGNCPKCNHKLSPLDWRQNCPNCGVNLMFYGFEDRFYSDAKYAEMGFAKVRVKWARVKAALIGGKIQIARLCLSLLPLLVAAIPLGGAELATKQFGKSVTFGLYGLYLAFTDGTITMLSAVQNVPQLAQIAQPLMKVYLGLAAVAVCAIFVLLFSLLCFFGAKVMARLVCISCILGAGCSAALMYIESGFLSAAKDFVFTTGTQSSAAVLAGAIAAFAVVFFLNFKIARKGIAVEYKEGDLFRVQMAKKLKKGEITLDEIPQPVYETEEERVQREKAIQEILDSQKGDSSAAEEAPTAENDTEVTDNE